MDTEQATPTFSQGVLAEAYYRGVADGRSEALDALEAALLELRTSLKAQRDPDGTIVQVLTLNRVLAFIASEREP